MRQIKEAIQISKLEEEKKQGKINLDFLKRKNQPKQEEKEPLIGGGSSIIPAPTTNHNEASPALFSSVKIQSSRAPSNVINVVPKNLVGSEIINQP